MPTVTQLAFTGIVAAYSVYLAMTNPWRSPESGKRLRSVMAIIAWWVWVATLIAILAAIWSPTVREWFGRVLTDLAAKWVSA